MKLCVLTGVVPHRFTTSTSLKHGEKRSLFLWSLGSERDELGPEVPNDINPALRDDFVMTISPRLREQRSPCYSSILLTCFHPCQDAQSS